MNKFLLLISAVIFAGMCAKSQEIVVAGWTFPGSSAESDTGVVLNMGLEIATLGGTSDIEFKNGLESKAAQATGWDNGMDLKAWVVEFSTMNFENLTISSVQQSGGNDPGPKDYKLQYSIEAEVWMDVPDGTIVCENNWTTSSVENLALPTECENIELLKIRWIMTSNEASGSGGIVLESGKNKIDNVFIRGEVINAINDYNIPVELNLFPNPTSGAVYMESEKQIEMIEVYNIFGSIIRKIELNHVEAKIDLADLPKGTYLLKSSFQDSRTVMSKIIIE